MTPGFPREFQPAVLKTPPGPFDRTRTGLSPSMMQRSRRLPLRSNSRYGGLTTPHLPCGIRFELCRFRSPLLTTSQLVSSPAPTKMFQFGAFPILTDRHRSVRSPIRVSPDQRLHAPPRSISLLGTPFIGTRTEPSPGRHSSPVTAEPI